MKTKKAFTLIELLVVVLIIGILAAIALPQYQKTVEKSRAAEAFTNLKSLMEMEEVARVETGAYVPFEDLNITLPGQLVNWMYETDNFVYATDTLNMIYVMRKPITGAPAVTTKYQIEFYYRAPQAGFEGVAGKKMCVWKESKYKNICEAFGCGDMAEYGNGSGYCHLK